MRNLNSLDRRDDLLDFTTPLPAYDPATDVLNQIQWSIGPNFDNLASTLTMTSPMQDYVDPALTMTDRQSLLALPVQRGLRVTFKPSSLGLDGSKTLWIQRTVRINGIDTVEPAITMAPPYQGVPQPTYILAGKAPSLTTATALQLELPASMSYAVISVHSGSNLGITFDKGAELQFAPNIHKQIITGSVSTIYLRGVGGASVFDIVFSKPYVLDFFYLRSIVDMLRVIHAQTQLTKLLIDDIDDGLPNKTSHRVLGDPHAAQRDGYASRPKQECYVPLWHDPDQTIFGFIDLNETQAVLLSAGKGKIAKMKDLGWVYVNQFNPISLQPPVIVTASLAGDLTITGQNFESIVPVFSTVVITGLGAVTLTQNDILGNGGTFNSNTIVIPGALIPGVASGASSVMIYANDQDSAVATIL